MYFREITPTLSKWGMPVEGAKSHRASGRLLFFIAPPAGGVIFYVSQAKIEISLLTPWEKEAKIIQDIVWISVDFYNYLF